MTLSWNEIKDKALKLSNESKDKTLERSGNYTFCLANEIARIDYLFELYNEQIMPLMKLIKRNHYD